LLRACGYRVELHAFAAELMKRPPDDGPSCLLLDIQLAGCNGPQLQKRLAALGSTTPIIFVTGRGDIPTAVRTIKAGAEDFLTKPVPKARLLDAIERALAHSEEARQQASRAAAMRSLIAGLSGREYDVFLLLVRGKLHKQIAYDLGISERTVKFHRHNVLQKLDVRSITDLAVIANRAGLLGE